MWAAEDAPGACCRRCSSMTDLLACGHPTLKGVMQLARAYAAVYARAHVALEWCSALGAAGPGEAQSLSSEAVRLSEQLMQMRTSQAAMHHA